MCDVAPATANEPRASAASTLRAQCPDGLGSLVKLNAGTLRYQHKSVGCTGGHVGIICAEARDFAEVVARKQNAELVSLPAAHREVVVAHALLVTRHQFVPLGDQQLPVFKIEGGDAREGQFATLGRDTLSEQRLPGSSVRPRQPIPGRRESTRHSTVALPRRPRRPRHDPRRRRCH